MKAPGQQRGPRFQFKIATLLLAMVLFSVLAAVFGGYFRHQDDGVYKSRFVLLTLLLPLGLVVAFGVLRAIMHFRNRDRRKRW